MNYQMQLTINNYDKNKKNYAIIMPKEKLTKWSYRMKYYSVESERIFGDIIVTQQSLENLYMIPSIYITKGMNQILRTFEFPNFVIKSEVKDKMQKHKNIINLSNNLLLKRNNCFDDSVINHDHQGRKQRIYPLPSVKQPTEEVLVSSLVDQLLADIYRYKNGNLSFENESSGSFPKHYRLQKARLQLKTKEELRVVLEILQTHINMSSGLLIRQLRKRDYLCTKRDKQYDVITAHLQAHSRKRIEDTRMRFSLSPQPGESGFTQWLDAMKMVVKLPGGIPHEFRRKLWLTLAERHLEQRGIDWNQAEKICFNEWTNPDDEELGIQIVKDLHRTGCSLFCGAAGRDNQAVLRRVLLGFARWNKSVGYCQGLNVLAALVLQVTDRAEASAVKVMIYLIEGVLPEGYFADNLRGLSIDMAVFRDLLRMRLPRLSKHLEALQSDTKDKPTGSSYEPPLTNVFTMQWFLTLFCHCLPQDAVLRVWDLIFLEGDEVLLKTALAIWEGISDRVMTVTSADEFYSIMGVLTREMLEFTDTNNLIKNIVSMGSLSGVTDLREKHRYNITPWARRLSDDEETDTEDEERIAVAAAMFGVPQRFKKDRRTAGGNNFQINPTTDSEKLALDINTLKHQYAKLRERQRQAHVILSAACARQTIVPTSTTQAMNHLLVGKSALISSKTRQLGPPPGSVPPKSRITPMHNSRNQIRRDKQDSTLHWKDMKKSRETKNEPAVAVEDDLESIKSIEDMTINHKSSRRNSAGSESDSTSTELCDEPDYLSDSEDLTSNSDYNSISIDSEKRPNENNSFKNLSNPLIQNKDLLSPNSKDIHDNNIDIDEIVKITDQIRRLSASDDINSIINDKLSNVNNDKEEEILGDGDSDDDIQLHKNIKPINIDILSPVTVDSLKLLNDHFEKINISENNCTNILCKENNSTLLDDKIDKDIKVNDDKEMEKDHCDLADHYSYSFDDNNLTSTSNKIESFNTNFLNKSDTVDYTNAYLDDEKDKSYRRSYASHLPIVSSNVDEKIDENVERKTVDLKDINDYEVETINDIKQTAYDMKKSSTSDSEYTLSMYKYDKKLISPQTPSDGSISLKSDETLGGESKVSSKTSHNPSHELNKYITDDDKFDNSLSISSNSKTLTLDIDNDNLKSKLNLNKLLIDKSTPSSPISSDSLKNNKSELTSPSKLVISSSCESYNSSNKLKYSEKSFSSGLQSPISANSIKYTSNYRGQDNYSESPNISSITSSPFYPISNQKTPSPNNRNNKDKDKDKELIRDNITDDLYNKYNKYHNDNDDYDSGRSFEAELAATLSSTKKHRNDMNIITSDGYKKSLFLNDINDDKVDERIDNCKPSINISYNDDDDNLLKSTKYLERSSSSLDNKLSDMKLSLSIDDFSTNKKRSSDILADLRHLEANTSEGIPITSVIMTRKTGYELEDLKNLEARRQDTFSDSAIEFSNNKIEIPNINITSGGRKTGYIVEPKIQIDENSDSILKNYAKNGNGHCNDDDNNDGVNGGNDDDNECKLGVWTKVKPKKRNENGRRSSSDRALKIIQENSAILHKILTCQAKKCLPDLEEISKEITISPINEEISKIFSPILEKMGLNEKEINEKLSKLNFKDLDDINMNNSSEFDSKINDELCKLSLIDDEEEIRHSDLDLDLNDDPDVDGMLSSGLLDMREALIDKKINEELSKLSANYNEISPDNLNLNFHDKSCKLNENLTSDMPSISTNVYYKSSNDSIETKSDVTTIKDSIIQPEKFSTEYVENDENYSVNSAKYQLEHNFSSKSDMDIYRELEKLDKISSAYIIHRDDNKLLSKISPISSTCSYNDVTSPTLIRKNSIEYSNKLEKSFKSSPLKSPHTNYKPYDFNIPKISPLKTFTNSTSFIPRSYEKSSDINFQFNDNNTINTCQTYDIKSEKRSILTKESLEFRVKYNDQQDNPIERKLYDKSHHFSSTLNYPTLDLHLNLDLEHDINDIKSSTYYNSTTTTNTNTTSSTKLNYTSEITPDIYTKKYMQTTSNDYLYKKSPENDYDRHRNIYKKLDDPTADIKTDLTSAVSTNYQFTDHNYDVDVDLTKDYSMKSMTKPNTLPLLETASRPMNLNLSNSPLSSSMKDCDSYKRNSMNLDLMDTAKKSPSSLLSDIKCKTPSPRSQFVSPFPVKNSTRKPKELGLKLGLYLPSTFNQSKRS